MRQRTYPTPTWSGWTRSWAAALAPQRCEVCGHSPMPAADWPRQWAQAVYGPLGEELNRAWAGMLAPWLAAYQPASAPETNFGHGLEHGCRGCCQPDDCHCRCCVSDADLLVHARVGERRVVPLVVENNLRRERTVELEISSFTAHASSGAQVTGQLLGPTTFPLKACEEQTVRLQVDITASGEPASTDSRSTPDVESCKVFYADLRVKGCDIRPVRIAVAVLPLDCSAYRIDCRAVCC